METGQGKKTYCFKLKKVESKRAVFTVSLRNINQFNVTRLKGTQMKKVLVRR